MSKCLIGRYYGEVFKGLDKKTNKVVAIKTVETKLLGGKMEGIEMLAKLSCPQVVQYFAYFTVEKHIWVLNLLIELKIDNYGTLSRLFGITLGK